MPSLKQLNEAVLAWIAENPGDLITVVVDATFGHRIDPKEVRAFDEAVDNNEIVAPPAGAIGRGDAFVLSIADKVRATILSNDSYQEFHGQYDWLFDEGRLIGGKPVPHIGWVFVARVPVRGPTSRKAVRDAKRKGGPEDGVGQSRRQGAKASKEAHQPMPVPKAPPPKAIKPEASKPDGGKPGTGKPPSSKPAQPARPPRGEARPAPVPVPASNDADRKASAHLNDLVAFLSFVEHHPIGTTVSGVVESYSSHGAYVVVGDVNGYVPLRLMGDPAPRSAREQMSIGDSVTLVVAGFTPGRRGIDLGLPSMVPTAPPPSARGRKKVAAPSVEPPPPSVGESGTAPAAAEVSAPAKQRRAPAKKALETPAGPAPAATSEPPVSKAAAKAAAKSPVKGPAKAPAKAAAKAPAKAAAKAVKAPAKTATKAAAKAASKAQAKTATKATKAPAKAASKPTATAAATPPAAAATPPAALETKAPRARKPKAAPPTT
jgi:hypothetical protein